MATPDTDVLTSTLGKPITLAYGRHVVAGNVILRHQVDDGRIIAFLALGEGEWDSIIELYVNGLPIDLNSDGSYHFHRGGDGERSGNNSLDPEGTGTPFPFILQGDQKVDELNPPGVQGLTFSRTAYIAINVPFDIYAPSPELDIRGVYRTRKVRLFNSDGVAIAYRYSENPAWQIADLLTRVRGLSDAQLDWTSFAEAAAYCDEEIDTGSGISPRFISNVAFTEVIDIDAAIEAILNTCRGHLMEAGGAIRLRIARPRMASFDFHDGNIVDGTFQAYYVDTRELPNRLELQFRDTDNNYSLMSKLWNHELQQSRTGKIVSSTLELGSMTQHQAERIGNYALTTAIDNNLFCRFSSTPESLAVLPGDVVRVQLSSAIWSQGAIGNNRFKDFEVVETLDQPDCSREFLCRAYNPAAYSDSAGPAQNLIATNIFRRPLPPPPPPVWGLSTNLAGDLKLRFAIPRNADYRTGELALLIDNEIARTVSILVNDLTESDESLVVSGSTGFLVGDYFNIGAEIFLLLGPGVKGAPPLSTAWSVGREQKGSQRETHAANSAIYQLIESIHHFSLPPGYSLTHPTGNLTNGPYYQVNLAPGRLRILQAGLELTGLGGRSESVSTSYALFGVSEPPVSGGLAGLRVSTGGKLQLQVTGPLATGADLIQPTYLPANVSLGLVYATVEKSPVGQPIIFQLLRDGQPIGPQGIVPETSSDEPSGSGVLFSGAELGGTGGSAISIDLIQVGSTYPGEDLTINITL